MSKKFKHTSKREYNTPIIDITELKNGDVLTWSDPDNVSSQARQLEAGVPRDLLDSIFSDD